MLPVVFHSFVQELQQQLVSCVNHFTNQLENFKKTEEDKIDCRDAMLRKEMKDAQQLVENIELLMGSHETASIAGWEYVRKCEEFLKNCIDISQCDVDFSYLDFVPAGRLYVKNEHLGYMRLSNAEPEDVELRLAGSGPAVCRRECRAVIHTNKSNCTNAKPNIDVTLNDNQDGPVAFKVINNNNGSYDVVFTPGRPGKVRLNVKLFGITVSSSPLEISVVDEVVTPQRVSGRGRGKAGSGSSDGSGVGASAERMSGMSDDHLCNDASGSAARTPSQPCIEENFDHGEYFASPQLVMTSSPGSAVPSKQKVLSPADDQVDFEDIQESVTRMTMNPADGGREYCSPSRSMDASAGHHSANSSACVEFEDLSHVPDNEFESPGLKLQLSYFYRLLALPVYCVEQGLCNCWASIRLSVPAWVHSSKPTVAGLLGPDSRIDCCTAHNSSGQMRVVPLCQPT